MKGWLFFMAGFFGFFDYSKPGPGVPKNAPAKPAIVVFFEVFGRKFWNLVQLNMMFFIFNLPALIISFVIIDWIYQMFGVKTTGDMLSDFIFRMSVAALLLCFNLITVGPAQAGFTYVLRNYSREEHAFLWSDFKETALKNFKQSTIVSVIDLFVVIFVGIDIYLYSRLSQNSILLTIASGFIIMALVIFVMMHLYIYPLLITFKLSVKQIYWNALLFSFIKLLPNIGILLICTILIGATLLIYPLIGFILFFFITYSAIGLITNFYAYPKLVKYIMNKMDSEIKSDDTGKINGK